MAREPMGNAGRKLVFCITIEVSRAVKTDQAARADAGRRRLDRGVVRPVLPALMWPRADPAELARFDPRTKLCTMNCGRHRDDPRTDAECKLLCGDCVEDWNR